MATQFEESATGSTEGLPPLVVPTPESARPLDRLAPLLHELLAWDLVRETEAGTFELPEDVQNRLRQLSGSRSGTIAEVYVGRKCGRCGSIRVTRMVDGVRLCSTCSSEVANPVPIADPLLDPPPQPHGRSRWHRKAG
jgi:hypothetical protein